jgi:hypothetical protein
MCSNKNNNRTRHLSHYVVVVNGVPVDRRRVNDPVLKVAGMPKPVTLGEQPTVAAARLTGAALPAGAATNALAPISAINRPRVYLPIPAFNPGPTIAAQRAALKQLARAHREAIRADRALRKQHHKQIRKLRSYKAAAENVAALFNLPQVARSNAEGLTAARELTPQQAPAQIFSQESLANKCRQYGHNPLAHALVKANIWTHSTMMTVVDLRDDEERSYDGNIIRRGAIYEPETALNCEKVNLQIWVEMTSNWQRALVEFRRVAQYCPMLRSFRVEVIGENNEQAAQDIMRILEADYVRGTSGFRDHVVMEFDASGYDA